MFEDLSRIDESLFRLINSGYRSPVFDKAMTFLSSDAAWIALITVVMGYIAWRKDRAIRNLFLIVVVGVGITDLFCYRLLKPFFERMRPCRELDWVYLIDGRCAGDLSFPSNHSANIAVVVTLLFLLVRREWVLWASPIAVAVGYSRIYLGMHYPGDVLGGFVIGISIASLIYGAVLATGTKKHFTTRH